MTHIQENKFSILTPTNQLLLFIAVGPDFVKLDGPTEAGHGEEVTFKCETSHSNPPASIQWTVNNRTVHSESWTEPSHRGGSTTKSSIAVSLGQNDKNKLVICKAINAELNAVKTDSKMLSIICKSNMLCC